jgi:AcrR family transcriptional regulator
MVEAILTAANAQLGTVGPARLSLRAVARELGMASSAMYRYFATRDDLLTALLVRAYWDLAQALTRAEGAVERADRRGRLRVTMEAERAWALANPHRWALLYGTPVPGYVAPAATIEPAVRFFELYQAVVAEALAAGELTPPPGGEFPAVPGSAIASAVAWSGGTLPTQLVAQGLSAWTWMLGTISAELGGHFANTVDDPAAFYSAGIEQAVARLGFR